MTDLVEAPAPAKKTSSTRNRLSAETIELYRSQEPDLITSWQEKGCAKSLTLLLERYGPMIGAQIQKILAGRSVGPAHRQDLEQEANIAFIQAVSSFDPSYGTYLSSFAMNHIRKNLLRYALDFRHAYRIGTSSAERKAFYAALTMRADRIHKGMSEVLDDKDIAEIQANTGASEKSTRRAVASIYSSRTNVDDAPDIAAPECSSATEHDIALTAAMEALAPFIETLDDRQKAILNGYLSDDDVQAHAIAQEFDVTPERIGQIKRDMLADMAIFLKKQGIEARDLF